MLFLNWLSNLYRLFQERQNGGKRLITVRVDVHER